MHIGSFDPLASTFFIAGPCLVEGEAMLDRVAGRLLEIGRDVGAPIVLKGSFKKANRTSHTSPSTIGEIDGLRILADAGRAHGMPTLTDIHETPDAELAARYVDVLQIPAFLSRQTELIRAAARTGKAVLIKKGQFMAPEDVARAVDKARDAGAETVLVCERGTTFGYHDLVVDMRGLIAMRESGVPVVFDATHSTQRPSQGEVSGGDRRYALPLARAACAVGVNGIFFETHPDPSTALSDRSTQIPLGEAEEFVRQCLAFARLHEEVAGDGRL